MVKFRVLNFYLLRNFRSWDKVASFKPQLKLEQEANDRIRQIQGQSEKLKREQDRNDQLENERDDLLQRLEQLENELEAAKKAQLADNDAKEQIKVRKNLIGKFSVLSWPPSNWFMLLNYLALEGKIDFI